MKRKNLTPSPTLSIMSIKKSSTKASTISSTSRPNKASSKLLPQAPKCSTATCLKGTTSCLRITHWTTCILPIGSSALQDPISSSSTSPTTWRIQSSTTSLRNSETSTPPESWQKRMANPKESALWASTTRNQPKTQLRRWTDSKFEASG